MGLFLALAVVLAGALAAPTSARALELEPIGNFATPTYVTSDPNDPDQLFVVEQDGRIRMRDGGISTFLDITDLVRSPEDAGGGNEQGLLSMAFSPDYATTGRFYVFYTAQEGGAGALRIDEFDADGEPIESTRRPVIEIPHVGAAQNHNGGQLQFGPDGHLYASTGDGGTSGANAQDLNSLLGKILRIAPAGSGPGDFSVPADNPFAGSAPGMDEIWSYGLRNPWRFSFDRVTGALTVADVGQGSWEEVNYEPESAGRGRGDDFGWNQCEGLHAFQAASDDVCTGSTFTRPVFEYANDASTCAITGGYVVRDPGLGDLLGRYLYADFCAGELRSLALGLPFASDDRSEGLSVNLLTSFGEDACGRVYVASREGPVHRLVGDSPTVCPLPAAPGPGPGPGPGRGPGADVTSPTLELSARKRQRIKRKRRVRVRARVDEAATVEFRAKPRRAARGKVRFGKRTADLKSADRARIRWRLSRREARKVRRQLRKGRRATVRVTGRATDAAGNAGRRDSVKIRLVR